MRVSAHEIDSRLAAAPGWSSDHDTLTRQFTFPSFPDAIAFVARLAFSCEAADHHPGLHVDYKRVRVTWTTHSEKGITDKDFAGVKESDRIAQALGGK